jgi:hypothetical protein
MKYTVAHDGYVWRVAWSENGTLRGLTPIYIDAARAEKAARRIEAAEAKYPMLAAIPTPYIELSSR